MHGPVLKMKVEHVSFQATLIFLFLVVALGFHLYYFYNTYQNIQLSNGSASLVQEREFEPTNES